MVNPRPICVPSPVNLMWKRDGILSPGMLFIMFVMHGISRSFRLCWTPMMFAGAFLML